MGFLIEKCPSFLSWAIRKEGRLIAYLNFSENVTATDADNILDALRVAGGR